MKYCPNCATECDDIEFFCHECGAKLDGNDFDERTQAMDSYIPPNGYDAAGSYPGSGTGGYGPSGYANNVQGYGPGGYGNSAQGYGPSGYGPSAQGYGPSGYGNSAQGYGPSGYGNSAQGYGPSGYANNVQGYGPSGYGNSGQGYGPSGYGNSVQGYGPSSYAGDQEGVTTSYDPTRKSMGGQQASKPKSKLPVIIGLLLLVCAAGGIGFYMLNAKKVTITYSTNNSAAQNMPEKQKVKSGEQAQKPSDPSADDCTFGGWFKDSALTEAYDFSDTVTEDITLYAGFFEDVSVSFVSRDVTALAMPSDQVVKYGEKISEPADPSANGYRFSGWYSNKKCTKSFDFDTEIKEDTVVYAGWTSLAISGQAKLADGADPIMHLDELGGTLLDAGETSIVDTNILGDGTYDFGNQPDGTYHIQLYYEGRVVADSGYFDYDAENSDYIPGVYVPAGLIAGRILNSDGTPCAGATIQFSGNAVSGQTKSGSDGAYTIKYLPADTYTITSTDAGGSCTSILLTVESDTAVVPDQDLTVSAASAASSQPSTQTAPPSTPQAATETVSANGPYYISANDRIVNIESQSASLEAQLDADSSNYSLIYSYFYLWDDVLNAIWSNEIQNARYGSMGESTYQSLLSNQLSWIQEKGGENIDLRAAQMTKSRCYYLRDYVKDYR